MPAHGRHPIRGLKALSITDLKAGIRAAIRRRHARLIRTFSSGSSRAMMPIRPRRRKRSSQKEPGVSHLVLAETPRVLDSVYDLSRAQLATALEMLLNHKELRLQDVDVVAAALGHYRQRSAVDFSDCLVLEIARKSGRLPVGTYDRNFAKLADVRQLG